MPEKVEILSEMQYPIELLMFTVFKSDEAIFCF